MCDGFLFRFFFLIVHAGRLLVAEAAGIESCIDHDEANDEEEERGKEGNKEKLEKLVVPFSCWERERRRREREDGWVSERR